MQQFGAYYRRTYGASLGIGESGCPPAGSVFVWADVDQRTRATGDAILAGLAPGCNIAVGHAPADPDPLFDPLPGIGVVNKAESMASVLGAVGGNLNALTVAYGGAFATMESVLGCQSPATCKRISQVPTTVANDGDGGLAGLSGGLDMAGDVAENMLLEYTNGNADVGWGRVDHARLLQLLAASRSRQGVGTRQSLLGACPFLEHHDAHLADARGGRDGQSSARDASARTKPFRLFIGSRHAARRVFGAARTLVADRRRSVQRHAAGKRADLRAARARRSAALRAHVLCRTVARCDACGSRRKPASGAGLRSRLPCARLPVCNLS